jgi:hypothetical protein
MENLGTHQAGYTVPHRGTLQFGILIFCIFCTVYPYFLETNWIHLLGGKLTLLFYIIFLQHVLAHTEPSSGRKMLMDRTRSMTVQSHHREQLMHLLTYKTVALFNF